METNNSKYLDEIGKKIPFQVPENYFENFAIEMDSRISTQQVTVRKMIAPWMYMAAMFVGVLFMANLFYTIWMDNKTKHAEMYDMYVSSQLDDSAMMEYYYNSTYVEEE